MAVSPVRTSSHCSPVVFDSETRHGIIKDFVDTRGRSQQEDQLNFARHEANPSVKEAACLEPPRE